MISLTVSISVMVHLKTLLATSIKRKKAEQHHYAIKLPLLTVWLMVAILTPRCPLAYRFVTLKNKRRWLLQSWFEFGFDLVVILEVWLAKNSRSVFGSRRSCIHRFLNKQTSWRIERNGPTKVQKFAGIDLNGVELCFLCYRSQFSWVQCFIRKNVLYFNFYAFLLIFKKFPFNNIGPSEVIFDRS